MATILEHEGAQRENDTERHSQKKARKFFGRAALLAALSALGFVVADKFSNPVPDYVRNAVEHDAKGHIDIPNDTGFWKYF